MPRKFDTGDRVVVKRLSSRTPLYIRTAIRLNRKRTVTSVYYDSTQQHTLYHLGSNKKGEDISDYGFRAEQLKFAVKRETGRPRLTRKYRARKV